MQRALGLMFLAGVSTVVCACGPGHKLGGGKEGAATALFMTSAPTRSSSSTLGSGSSIQPSVTVSCPLEGKATLYGVSLAADASGTGASLSSSYTLDFQGCATTTFDDPKSPAVEKDLVLLNGNMGITQLIDLSNSSAEVTQGFKGRLKLDGAFDDFLDSDVRQKVEAQWLGAQSGSVTVTLDGTITTSSGTYTYSNETVSFTAGHLTAALKD